MAEKESSPEEYGAKRLSDEDYEYAVEAYESGEKNLVDLAAELDVSRQALSKRFKRNGVEKGSKKKAAEIAEEERYSEKRSEWIEKTRVSGYKALSQTQLIARKIVADQLRSGSTIDGVEGQLKAVQRYNKTLVDNIAATLSVLNADDHVDEDDLPMLVVEDMTNEMILQHHKDTGALPEDATIDDIVDEELEIPAEFQEE